MHQLTAKKYLKICKLYTTVMVTIAGTCIGYVVQNEETIREPIVVEAEAISFDNLEINNEIETEEVHEETERISIPTPRRQYSDAEIQEMILQGLFTEEDFNYLVSCARECPYDYDGYYAVASCIMNRLHENPKYNSIKEVVTEAGQFEGYADPYSQWSLWNKYCTPEVKAAAVNVLLGGESNIGRCTYFRGRVSGHDMWADKDISEFYVWGGNVFYTTADRSEGNVIHNANGEVCPASGILIYSYQTGEWKYNSGSRY